MSIMDLIYIDLYLYQDLSYVSGDTLAPSRLDEDMSRWYGLQANGGNKAHCNNTIEVESNINLALV